MGESHSGDAIDFWRIAPNGLALAQIYLPLLTPNPMPEEVDFDKAPAVKKAATPVASRAVKEPESKPDRNILIGFDPTVQPGLGSGVHFLPYPVHTMTDEGLVDGGYDFYELIPGAQEISESLFELISQSGIGRILCTNGAIEILAETTSILDIGGASTGMAFAKQMKIIRGCECLPLLTAWVEEAKDAGDIELLEALNKRMNDVLNG